MIRGSKDHGKPGRQLPGWLLGLYVVGFWGNLISATVGAILVMVVYRGRRAPGHLRPPFARRPGTP